MVAELAGAALRHIAVAAMEVDATAIVTCRRAVEGGQEVVESGPPRGGDADQGPSTSPATRRCRGIMMAKRKPMIEKDAAAEVEPGLAL